MKFLEFTAFLGLPSSDIFIKKFLILTSALLTITIKF